MKQENKETLLFLYNRCLEDAAWGEWYDTMRTLDAVRRFAKRMMREGELDAEIGATLASVRGGIEVEDALKKLQLV
jgi:hypothetical protein